METLLAIGRHPAYHGTLIVPHHDECGRLYFEILLPEPDEDISALLGPLARRAQQAIRRDLPEDAEADRLQLEFGYAIYPAEAQTPAALQEKARTARIRSV